MPPFEREISLQTEWHQVETLHEGFLSSKIYVLFVMEAHSTVLRGTQCTSTCLHDYIVWRILYIYVYIRNLELLCDVHAYI